MLEDLITDRTEADVFFVKNLAEAIKAGTATEEQVQQYLIVHQKGAYTCEDLNRVEAAVEYVAARLREYGYPVLVPEPRSWSTSDKLNEDDVTLFFGNVSKIRNAITVFKNTPIAPQGVAGFGVNQANALEQILVDVERILNLIRDGWLFLGDIYSGEM